MSDFLTCRGATWHFERRVPLAFATEDHSVYSLRHSFKDWLIAVEVPDSLIDSLMGHKAYKPKYKIGPSLELKLKFLEQVAFRAPA